MLGQALPEPELDPESRAAFDTAYNNIRAFHEAQRAADVEVETMPGVRCRRITRPIGALALRCAQRALDPCRQPSLPGWTGCAGSPEVPSCVSCTCCMLHLAQSCLYTRLYLQVASASDVHTHVAGIVPSLLVLNPGCLRKHGF